MYLHDHPTVIAYYREMGRELPLTIHVTPGSSIRDIDHMADEWVKMEREGLFEKLAREGKRSNKAPDSGIKKMNVKDWLKGKKIEKK